MREPSSDPRGGALAYHPGVATERDVITLGVSQPELQLRVAELEAQVVSLREAAVIRAGIIEDQSEVIAAHDAQVARLRAQLDEERERAQALRVQALGTVRLPGSGRVRSILGRFAR